MKAHGVARLSLAAAGASIVGAAATAQSGGPVHFVFAVGALGSLLTMAAAHVASGSDRTQTRAGEGLAEQVSSVPAPAPARVAVAFAVPVAVPVAVAAEDEAEQDVPELAGPAVPQARRAA
ncbi:hypothetical protein [Catenulispora yoronensis]|uniref:hypothetical protein n=1 Tax=Catenulispora yoronensis TaxID=450799 RepID=UPI0031D8DAF1